MKAKRSAKNIRPPKKEFSLNGGDLSGLSLSNNDISAISIAARYSAHDDGDLLKIIEKVGVSSNAKDIVRLILVRDKKSKSDLVVNMKSLKVKQDIANNFLKWASSFDTSTPQVAPIKGPAAPVAKKKLASK